MSYPKIHLIFNATLLAIIMLVSTSGYMVYRDHTAHKQEIVLKLSELERKFAQYVSADKEKYASIIKMMHEQAFVQTNQGDLRTPAETYFGQEEILSYLNEHAILIDALSAQVEEQQQLFFNYQEMKHEEEYADTQEELTREDQRPPSIEEMEAQLLDAEKATAQRLDEIETRFQSQPQDSDWAYDSNIRVQYALDDLKTNQQFDSFSVGNIDCRTSMCKIELLHDAQSDDVEMLKMELMASLADVIQSSSSEHTLNTDGTTSTTYYFSN